jgi:hypothetical protein
MRDRRLLVVAVALALVFSAAWLWRAAGDGVTERVAVPDGASTTADGVVYRLASLRTSERVTSGAASQIVATRGATLVVATVRYDATMQTGDVYCGFALVAGEATWEPEFGWLPPEGQASFCDSGSAGTVTALFEVPQGFLDQVQGILVTNPGGASPLLLGRPG